MEFIIFIQFLIFLHLKKKEVLLDKPICLGFIILELNTLLMYGTYCDQLQPNFAENKVDFYSIDTQSFI